MVMHKETRKYIIKIAASFKRNYFLMKYQIKPAEIFRFIVTGGTSTFIDFIVYFGLTHFISITKAKICSMLISCIYAFCINKVWTFQVEKRISAVDIIKYILAQSVNIGINVGINTLMYYISKDKLISYILATGMAMICNFCLQKFFVFRQER